MKYVVIFEEDENGCSFRNREHSSLLRKTEVVSENFRQSRSLDGNDTCHFLSGVGSDSAICFYVILLFVKFFGT